VFIGLDSDNQHAEQELEAFVYLFEMMFILVVVFLLVYHPECEICHTEYQLEYRPRVFSFRFFSFFFFLISIRFSLSVNGKN
jgi:hypothetical protein